jgi:proteic killer suppression protein
MLALRRGDGRVPTHRGVLQADSQCHVLHPAGARSWGSDHAKRRSTTARQEILGRSGPIYGHGLTQRALDSKLEILDAAEVLQDLRIPPSNRLEKLSGNREGQYSIRINDQWRICFAWQQENAYDVEIVDYH